MPNVCRKNITRSRSNPSVNAFFYSSHNPTFLRENAGYFQMEAEYSCKGEGFIVLRHRLQDGNSVENSMSKVSYIP